MKHDPVLTDEEMKNAVDPISKGWTEDSDFASISKEYRAIEQAVLSKLAEKSEPVAYVDAFDIQTLENSFSVDEVELFKHNPMIPEFPDHTGKYVALYTTQQSPQLLEAAEMLDFLSQPHIETAFDMDLDEERPFVVGTMTGGRNDREWDELGRGETLREAIRSAIEANRGLG